MSTDDDTMIWFDKRADLFEVFSQREIDSGFLIARDDPHENRRQLTLFTDAKDFQEYQGMLSVRNFYEIIPGHKAQKLKEPNRQ
jgi:hypothetical protein